MFRVHTWGGIGDGGEGGLIWMRIHLAANQAAMTIQLPIETPPCIVSPRPRRMNICEQSPTTTGTALVQCDGFEHHRLERQMPRRSNVNNSTGRAVPNENISRRFLFCSPRDVRFAEVVANLRKFLNPVVCCDLKCWPSNREELWMNVELSHLAVLVMFDIKLRCTDLW